MISKETEDFISGVFTEEFCEQLWNKSHPNVKWKNREFYFMQRIAKLQAWEMMG